MKMHWRGLVLILIVGVLVFMSARKNEHCADHTVHSQQKLFAADFFAAQQKYCKGGSIEPVIFCAQEHEASSHTQLRYGIFYKNPKAKATILVCHGFMCDKFDVGFFRQALFADYNVFAFDFRAHGHETAKEHVCTFGKDEALDVEAAGRFLKYRDDVKKLPFIAYGFSMGAVAAIRAQEKNPKLFDAMILDCPFDSSQNIIKKGMERLQFTIFGYTFVMPGRDFLEKYAFNVHVQSFLKTVLKLVAQMDATQKNTAFHEINPAESIKNITIPCLFIHCQHDEKVPTSAAFNLYNNAAGYKRLWVTNGRRHFDSFFYNPEKYIYKVNEFIDAVITKKIKNKVREKIYFDDKSLSAEALNGGGNES